jgi:hypothetical protein
MIWDSVHYVVVGDVFQCVQDAFNVKRSTVTFGIAKRNDKTVAAVLGSSFMRRELTTRPHIVEVAPFVWWKPAFNFDFVDVSHFRRRVFPRDPQNRRTATVGAVLIPLVAIGRGVHMVELLEAGDVSEFLL